MKLTMLKRPTDRDPEVIEAAVKLLFPSVWDWITASSSDSGEYDERETVLEELIKVFKRRSIFDYDGYRLARLLEESCMWESDSDLVSVLDSYYSFLSQAHRDAVKEWVLKNSIIPKKNIGDFVNVDFGERTHQGRIIGIDEATGQYTINVPALQHVEYVFNGDKGLVVATQVDKSQTGTLGVRKPVEEIDGETE